MPSNREYKGYLRTPIVMQSSKELSGELSNDDVLIPIVSAIEMSDFS